MSASRVSDLPRAVGPVAFVGCIGCGLILEGEAFRERGHLTSEDCPDCGARLRIVDRVDAEHLAQERFLTAYWRELAASMNAQADVAVVRPQEPLALQRELPKGLRRPLLQRSEFDSNPRMLRETLLSLEGLLAACAPAARRRALLTFGELVAAWQPRFRGERISVIAERLPNALRLNVGNSRRLMTPTEWTELVAPSVSALVDQWGIDRRLPGRAWFEFRWERTEFHSDEDVG